MSPAPPLVLASASPRRRALLAALGLEFEVRTADVDESPRMGERPAVYALRVAGEKATAIAAAHGGGPARILAADTVVALDDAILGKPDSAETARDYLTRLRGRRHLVLTAVVVADAGTGRTVRETCCTGVWLRHYSAAEVEAYIASGDPFDKAGGYAIQHPEFKPVAALQGSEANVIGLPTAVALDLLARLGG